ncbi:fungal-specific transcription factor domain-containing protein [Xylariales sp. PMI_506]|nr:fungal-specific transcription factor domain-containing protein [Xylariales sp. PMI_506]
MMPSESIERPYRRSPLRSACLSCRRRKSRCKIEPGSSSCLACRAHGTDCMVPSGHGETVRRPSTPRHTEVDRPRKGADNVPIESTLIDDHLETQADNNSVPGTSDRWAGFVGDERNTHLTPLSVDDAETENPHIVGPANTTDSQVLADYLAVIGNGSTGMRMVRPVPSSRSKLVLFVAVKKRPLGVQTNSGRASKKLHLIECLIAPYANELLILYFSKNNNCLPLLDQSSFELQYRTAKEKISPALLACLYAHSLIYWTSSPTLAQHRPPDNRAVWNLANDALYSELHLSPGISTATAILVNVGGRPTTSLIGNGVQLGAAVSLAHSLGLNHDPMPWDTPETEKLLRMKIWWTILIHDRWLSLAHGTPPHIQKSQYDVSSPGANPLLQQSQSQAGREAAPIFIAFFGLTEVLEQCLQQLYNFERTEGHGVAHLELKLNQWLDKLEPQVRRIITRGTQLEVPGAANLRLAFLAIVLLLRRLELENCREQTNGNPEVLTQRYLHARRSAEEIVLFVQDLGETQLRDFWHPVSAFIFPSTGTFLLRCALETENSQEGLAQSNTLRLAWDLITSLKAHRDNAGWDLGDICLSQYAEVVEKLMTPTARGEPSLSLPKLQELNSMDATFLDEFLTNIWDPGFQPTYQLG